MPAYKVIDQDGKSCITGTHSRCWDWIARQPLPHAYRIVDLFWKPKTAPTRN